MCFTWKTRNIKGHVHIGGKSNQGKNGANREGEQMPVINGVKYIFKGHFNILNGWGY